jgi:hypothetical protein
MIYNSLTDRYEPEDHGLMMNFCPFYGAKIDWFREKYSPAKEKRPEEAHDI